MNAISDKNKRRSLSKEDIFLIIFLLTCVLVFKGHVYKRNVDVNRPDAILVYPVHGANKSKGTLGLQLSKHYHYSWFDYNYLEGDTLPQILKYLGYKEEDFNREFKKVTLLTPTGLSYKIE